MPGRISRSLVVALVVLVPAAPASAAPDIHEELFEEDGWHQGWLDWRALDEARTGLTPAYHGNGLGVNIPPRGRRGAGPHLLLPDGAEDVYFRYHLRLDSWDAIDNGKLPGLADIGASTARGCFRSTESDPGWSARVLFRPPGTNGAQGDDIRLGYYTYHLDQPGPCGEFMHWDDTGIVEQRRWTCIEGRAAVNSPGENDGVLEAWVDGALAFRRTDLAFRRVAEDHVQVRSFWLNVFFGGSRIANDTHLGLRIDDLAIGTSRIGCLTRFTDDDGNPHEADIEYLFNEDVLLGCGADQVCPDRLLSRAEAMALLERMLAPLATGNDFFDDDTGHWAEGAMNRLAPLGVVRGCGERRACPDDPVSRGELAAFIRRAFQIPGSDTDHFSDDDSSVFAADIDAIAAAGITRGCGGGSSFCPRDLVRRDQAAALLARAHRWSVGG